MLKCAHLTPHHYLAQPWKNGKGETREIAVDKESPYRWRVAWATIPFSGPFSAYPDYDRKLALLSEGPVTIIHAGRRPKLLTRYETHAFRGDWETESTVLKSEQDFNLFTRRENATGSLYPAIIRRAEEIQLPLSAQEHFIFCAEGEMEIREPNQNEVFTLRAGDTLRISRPSEQEYLNLRAHGRAGRSHYLWTLVRTDVSRRKKLATAGD